MLLVSCYKESQTIGVVSTSENPYLTLIDTIGGSFYIHEADSFQTSASNTVMAGITTDPYFGKITSEVIARFSLPSITTTFSNQSAYDSLVLLLPARHYAYGDTTANFTLNAYELSGFDETKSTFYNVNTYPSFPASLGSCSGVFSPSRTDTFRIRFNDAMGLNWYNSIRNSSSAFAANTSFQNFFKGIRVAPGAGNKMIAGIQNNTSGIVLRLYYHTAGLALERSYIDFTTSGTAYVFSHITADRTGTPLQGLTPTHPIACTSINNLFLAQQLTGVTTQVYFDGLTQLPKLAYYTKLLAASLQLYPLKNSYSNTYPLPQAPALYELKMDGSLSGSFVTSSGTVQTGSLQTDNIYGNNTYYTYDISSYATAQQTANEYTRTKIVIASSYGDSTFTRLVGGTTAHVQNPSFLKTYLLLYKQ